MTVKKLAPIVIFAFNRPSVFKRMLESLQLNPLFGESKVIVFVDGARNEAEKVKVQQVVEIAHTVTDEVFVSQTNKGLGPSVIAGVTKIINQYDKVIVIEDDLQLMPGFLTYMNDALDQYQSDNRIFSVCGYGFKIHRPKNYDGDVYLGIRSSSWGWGTWKDRWNSIDWEVKDWEKISSDKNLQKAFNKGGSDMYSMLKGYMEGRNRSWAIRFCYSQHKQKKFSVHPFLSYVDNNGFGEEATNCKSNYSRFKVALNQSTHAICMPTSLSLNKSIIKDINFYHCIPLRLYSLFRKKFLTL